MPNITNITPPRVPLTDPNTGLITREWYRFFLNLFTLTGGGTSDISVSDLAKAPASMSAEAFAQVNDVYNALAVLPRNELGTLAPLNQDNVPWLRFNTGTALGYTPPIGTVFWNGGTTLTIQNTASVSQPVGEAQYFYIKATAAITKGQVIMFDGSVGASGQLKGKPATGVTDGQYIMGIAAEDIALNGFGIVTNFGLVRGFNTTGGAEAWTDGTILYYNPAVTGGLTKTVPSAPNVKVVMAAVVYASSGGAGSVFVRVGAGSALGQTDSNVQFGTLNNGDLIQYDSALGYWKNVPSSSIVVTTATNLAGGLANEIPYQSAPDTTTFIPAPTTRAYLNWSGTAFQWTTSVSLDGTAARTFDVLRNTTANTAGSNLTVNAGGATSGATDKNGGDLYLASGVSTGTGSSNVYFQTYAAGSTGTTDNTATTRMTILGIGYVGVGVSPSFPLDIGGTTTAAIAARFAQTITCSSGTYYGLLSQTLFSNATTNAIVVNGSYYQSRLALTNASGSITSFALRASTSIISANTVGSITSYGVYAESTIYSSGSFTSLTIPNTYGIFVDNQATTVANVTKTTSYGLYLSNQAAGGGGTGPTNVWAFYSVSGQSSHAGNFRFGSNVAPVATVDITGTLSVSSSITVGGVTSTGATGTGKFVFDTSPVLITPALGTPSSGTLTNCTGLPIGTGLSGLTANGVAYATSTTALATGTALTFDGAKFSVGGNSSGSPKIAFTSGQIVNQDTTTAFATSKFNSQGTAWTTDATLPSFIFNGSAAQRPEISYFRGTRSYPEFSIRQHTSADTGAELYAGAGTAAPTLQATITRLGVRVLTNLGRGAPVTKTADFTVADTENWLINNKSGSTCTVTLPTASSYTGREIMIKTIQAQTVVSASSNVVPLAGGAAGTAILAATAGKYATLVSDGTNWVIMQAN